MVRKWPVAVPLGVVLLLLITTVGVVVVITDIGRYIPSPLPLPVSFERVASGDHSGVASEGYRLVRSATEWDEFVASYPGVLPDGAPAHIDPGGRLILVVFQGEEPSAGHSIRVTSITRAGTEILVRLRETAPGAGCDPTPGPTQPFDVILMPRVEGDLVLLTQRAVEPCR